MRGQALENFLLKIGRPRQTVRRIDSSLKSEVKSFGGRLYESVFRDEIEDNLVKSERTALDNRQGLRIRLLLDPAIADLPWEYLYRERDNRFFSTSIRTPIVRYLEVDPPSPLEVTYPIHLLTVISAPRGYPGLDLEGEWDKLKEALAEQEASGHVKLERLDSATVDELQHEFQRAEYHVLHFIGHGGFREGTDEGVLLFENEVGEAHFVSGEDLGILLRDQSSIRLVLLNACEGGRGSLKDPFSGTAQTLIGLGIPAVVAMQFEITDTAAVRFTRSFYGALAAGFPLDSAVAEARKSIWVNGNETEWGTPVLYMVAPDGCIFDLPKRQQVQARKQHDKFLEEERLGSEQDVLAGAEQVPITPQKQRQPGRQEVERLQVEEEPKVPAAQDGTTQNKGSSRSKISSFLTSAPGVILAIALVLGAASGLYLAFNSGEDVDCSTVAHPSYGTDLRTAINDGLREHYSYDGLYVVEEMTMVDGWAYTQAHPQEGKGSGVDRAYLLRHNGLEWVWHWEGDINPQPGQPGLPPSLPGPVAAALFSC